VVFCQFCSSCFGEGSCRRITGIVLEPLDQGLEFSYSSPGIRGGFSVMHTRCSVKCVSGFELLVGSILVTIVLHMTLLASIVIFHCDFRLPNPVSRANSFSIAM
jgi:hypothetical protein